MVDLGDIVSIGGLCSRQGRKLNGCFGKVTSSAKNGRVGVTPFTDKEGRPLPFGEAPAVNLKIDNVRVLPKDPTSHQILLYRKSLHESLSQDRIHAYDRDLYFSLLKRESINKNEAYVHTTAQWVRWKALFGSTILVKFQHAGSLLQSNNKEALKAYSELLRQEEQRDVNEFSFVRAYHWYVFDLRIAVAECLINLGSHHQALDVIWRAEAPRDRESFHLMYSKLEVLSEARNEEECGEVVHRKLLDLYASFGMKQPTAFLEFGQFYGKMGKLDLSLAQYENALGVLAQMDSNRNNRILKECVEIDIAGIKYALDLVGSVPAHNGYSWTCSRSTEKTFDLGLDLSMHQPSNPRPSSNAIASLGDIVFIGALTSKQGIKLNNCFGKVTASVNDVGRVTVALFSDAEGNAVTFDESSAVRLKLCNVTVLPKDIDSYYMTMYRLSLKDSIGKNWVAECNFHFLPTRKEIRRKGRFVNGNAQRNWKIVFATEIEGKSELAQAMVSNGDDEGAAKVFAELLRLEEERDATDFDSFKEYRWFLFDTSVNLAECLIRLDAPHQAQDVIQKLEPLRDDETLSSTIAVLGKLNKALESEKCGEAVQEKIVKTYSIYGMKMPIAFKNFAEFYWALGKGPLALAQFKNALVCLEKMDDTAHNRMMKESFELDVQELKGLLEKDGKITARDGFSWTCTRCTEKKFELCQ